MRKLGKGVSMLEVPEFSDCERHMKIGEAYNWWNTKGQELLPECGSQMGESGFFQMVLAYHLHTQGVEASLVRKEDKERKHLINTPGVVKGPSVV